MRSRIIERMTPMTTVNNELMATIADLLVKAMADRLTNDETFIAKIVSKAVEGMTEAIKLEYDTVDERIEKAIEEISAEDFTIQASDIKDLDEAIREEMGNMEMSDIKGLNEEIDTMLSEHKFLAEQIEDLDEAVCHAVAEKLAR